MVEPISVVAGGVSVVQGTVGFLQFLAARVREADVIAALFGWNGERVDGDHRIAVQNVTSSGGRESIWWIRVVGLEGFEFVLYATNPYLETRISYLTGDPDRQVWRWVYPPHVGQAHGGRPDAENARTSFIVIGYRPAALVRHFVATRATER